MRQRETLKVYFQRLIITLCEKEGSESWGISRGLFKSLIIRKTELIE